ncbi:MAG TPA: methyltransferase domain-containing protein [Candidatus Polarisedimenticolaceae bacterium]|nr:methyltransferase domain-containing protein [Candidatus Polarisedimenticolaceae bacterium]
MLARTWASCALAALLAAAPAATPAPAPVKPTKEPPYSDVAYWKSVLDDPARREWQKPGTLLQFLGVAEGETVADLGAGTGYFTISLAELVGADGKVFAIDVEPKMLELIDGMREKFRFGNVTTILATPDDPKLPDGQVDLILVANTWHLIKNHDAYIPKLARALKGSRRVAIVDWREGEMPLGPPVARKLGRDKVVAEFTRAGWKLSSESMALLYQYVLVFVPPVAAAAKPAG